MMNKHSNDFTDFSFNSLKHYNIKSKREVQNSKGMLQAVNKTWYHFK